MLILFLGWSELASFQVGFMNVRFFQFDTPTCPIWYYSIIPKVKLMSPSLNQKVKWQVYCILCPANTDLKRIAGNVTRSWIFNCIRVSRLWVITYKRNFNTKFIRISLPTPRIFDRLVYVKGNMSVSNNHKHEPCYMVNSFIKKIKWGHQQVITWTISNIWFIHRKGLKQGTTTNTNVIWFRFLVENFFG